MMKHILHTKGFTLVEAMVAISILSLAITGPLLIAQKGVASSIYARDQITAFYLAQEAVEYIRNVRDTNRIKNNSWLTGLDVCMGGNKCQIFARYADHTDPQAITQCPGNVCSTPLSVYKNAQGEAYYGYGIGTGWTPSLFTREVSIDTSSSPHEALISVRIFWNTNLFTPQRSFTVKEYIFDF